MAIRNLILTRENYERAFEELQIQWQEMAGAVNDFLNHVTITRSGIVQMPENTVASVAVDTQLTDEYRTTTVTVTAKTMTLPACSSDRIGQEWTVHLGVDGYVTIQPSGSDVITLPTTDTTVTIYNKGSSLTFRCLSTTTWGIV